MDKEIAIPEIKLQPEALKELIQFIRKRGFSDPVLIREILDHFACKTEELLSKDPRLSLSEAMTKAHESFGIRGFLPIVEAYGQYTFLKYKRIYRKFFLKVITHPKWLPLILLTGVGTYYVVTSPLLSVLNAGPFLGLFGIGFFIALLLMTEWTAMFFIIFRKTPWQKNTLLQNAVRLPSHLSFIFWIFLMNLHLGQAADPESSKALFISILLACLTALFQVNLLSLYFTIQEAKKETDASHQPE